LSLAAPAAGDHHVSWEIGEDEAFSRIVRRGSSIAPAADAHSVHVEVDGLQAGRDYWYRFMIGGQASATGRARTAPLPGAPLDRLTIASASCQHFECGYYAAWQEIAHRRPDLVLFHGDYIYEHPSRGFWVRRHMGPPPRTLAQYRQRYGQYRSDPQLQAAHAAAPWISIWDDHEVENDYAGEQSEHLTPRMDFLRQRAAAYKAWWEHMPLRAAQRPIGAGAAIYRRARFGDLAALHMLDTRQYRSPQPCPKSGQGGGNSVGAACQARFESSLTMLGAAQESWLEQGLAQSGAGWTVIVQTTLMAPLDFGFVATRYRTDHWDGYVAARDRLLASIEQTRPANPLVLGGDIHAFVVADLKRRYDGPATPILATEFVTTSISSLSPLDTDFLARLAPLQNPHIGYASTAWRGYTWLTLRRDAAAIELRAVDDPGRADSALHGIAHFEVEAGRPGAQRVSTTRAKVVQQ